MASRLGLPPRKHFDYSSFMETTDAIAALTALGHAKRLAIFRLLVVAGPAGRMAGDIGDELGMPGATLSFHLKELANAGLVTAEPQGRFVCYRAAFDAMNGLIAYLTHNCCAGSADAGCAPVSGACRPGDSC
ncbi:transcriptional regulator, ArsR family [Dyella jiangningensis]|nr:ArsR family transcriptional regulator [Dyella sp. AtDHG13]SDL28318.1 transcriptional regulator, ArsR family [Dyella jiangningensis]